MKRGVLQRFEKLQGQGWVLVMVEAGSCVPRTLGSEFLNPLGEVAGLEEIRTCRIERGVTCYIMEILNSFFKCKRVGAGVVA